MQRLLQHILGETVNRFPLTLVVIARDVHVIIVPRFFLRSLDGQSPYSDHLQSDDL